MSLFLTISICDGDHPDRRRERTVECRDLWDAIYELREVAGSGFASELMNLSWSALTRAGEPPPDAGVAATVR